MTAPSVNGHITVPGATVEGVLKEARPGDEIRVVRIGGPRVGTTGPLRHTIGPFMEAIRQGAECGGYGSPLWDAVAIAARSLQDSVGRRLVLVATDGRVTGSWLDREQATDHAIMHRTAVSIIDGGRTERIQQEGGETALVQSAGALRWLAERTGGQYLPDLAAVGRIGAPNPYPLARRAINAHRHAYVLRIDIGAGGPRPAVKVTVRRPGLVVRAPAFLESRPVPAESPLPSHLQPQTLGDCAAARR